MLQKVDSSLVNLPFPAAQFPISSNRIFIDIINNTTIEVFACDFDGNRTPCPPVQPLGFAKQSLIVRYRSLDANRLKEERSQKPTQKPLQYIHGQFEISAKDLKSGDVFYLKELGYTIGIDEQEVLLQHPKLDLTIQRVITETVFQELGGHQDSILKCIINDPLGRFKQAYIGIYGHVFQTKVSTNEHLEPRCDIYCRNLNGEYDVYSLELEALAKGLCEIKEFDESSMCICTDKETVHAWVFRTRGKNTIGFTKEEIEKVEKDLKKYYEAIISEKNDELKAAKHRYDLLNATLQTKLNQEMMLSKHEHDKRQMDQDAKIEDLKYKKEVVSAKTADVAAVSNLIKAAAIIIPALVGLVIYVLKQSDSSDKKKVFALASLGLAMFMGGFHKVLSGSMSWLVNLFS